MINCSCLESKELPTSYNTLEEAEAALNAFLNAEENQSREFYFEGSVVGPKGNGTYTTTEINETFNSKAEAEAFLNGLKESYKEENLKKIEESITPLSDSINQIKLIIICRRLLQHKDS